VRAIKPAEDPSAAGGRGSGDSDSRLRTQRRVALAGALVVAAALLAAWRLGLLHQLSDPAHAAAQVVALGVGGYAAFILAYALANPFGVPGTLFVTVASLIWPWPVAFALSLTGTMAASVIGFGFARLVAREKVHALVPARFHRYDEALPQRGFATVVLLRLLFWMAPLLHAFLGVSRVPFWTHFWGSLVGYVVPLFVLSYFGAHLFEMLRVISLQGWLVIGATAVLIVTAAYVVRRRSAMST
jgi:uncharacterized membrane protein YdjX (TVP38/TMEM64 family)